MRYALRPYQQEAADLGVAYLENRALPGRHGIVVAPTGSGKSLVIASIVTRLHGPCIVFQPSKEILEQNLAKLASFGYRAAVFSASLGRKEVGTITLATIGSVMRHAEKFRDLPYALVDECHLVNSRGGMYAQFLAGLPSTRVLGLTATPYRLASNSFGSELRFLTRTRPRIFRDVVHATQIGDLFASGYLAPLAYREVVGLRPDSLRPNSTGADYSDASVLSEMRAQDFSGRLEAEIRLALAEGRRNVLVFTRFVAESERLAAAIPGCAVVTAETPAAERAHILDAFRAGRLRVVTNVGIVALGFDYPELECVILGRPTLSLGLYYQQVGRIVRPHPSKPVAYVVDLVGLVQKFGKVEDIVLRHEPAGPSGPKWEVCAGTRPLTNVLYESRRVW